MLSSGSFGWTLATGNVQGPDQTCHCVMACLAVIGYVSPVAFLHSFEILDHPLVLLCLKNREIFLRAKRPGSFQTGWIPLLCDF
jgi:hypothetical protein